MMLLYVAVVVLFLFLYLGVKSLVKSLWFVVPASKATKRAKPVFNADLIRNPPEKQEVEFDTDKRDRVLKNSFSPDKIPKDLDAIVIGSGIGGLCAAALLAKIGKKVLVLEQHDQAGGCCHVYAEKGFEFDVGIHYVGLMSEGSVLRLLSDQLSNSKLRWEPLDQVYDILAIGENYERRYPLESGRGVLMESLLKRFPEEEKGIRKFFSYLKDSGRALAAVAMLKGLPKAFSRFLLWCGVMQWMFPGMRFLKDTLSEVLNELISDKDLRAILGYSFGDYGTPPNETPFFMQALLTNHYTDGAYYPRGGASEIAYNIIPTITSADGCVLVRVKATKILLNDTKDCAIGVRVQKGRNEYDLTAPLVISDAGVLNTYHKLLPPEISVQSGMDKVLTTVKPGLGLFSVFIGLDATKEELGLEPRNIWAFKSNELDNVLQDYISLPPEEARNTEVPLIFLSFPSTKDPTYNTRYPGKTTCAIITITPYEWFEEWKEGKVMHRGEDYESFKTDIANKMWEQVLTIYPTLEDKREYMEVGTPLSNQFYLATSKGEVYGLDHDTKRFDPYVALELRPQTCVTGLYLTGQDVYCCGYGGGLVGGVLCVSAIMERNLMLELRDLREVWKKENKKQK